MNYYLTLLGILFLYFNFWFLVSLIRKRNDVVDIAWGLGFVLMTWSALWLSGNYEERQWLITTLITLWGIRLSWHIFTRNKNKEEDTRYQKLRAEWKNLFVVRSYFFIYLLQGVLLFIIVLPVLYIQKESYSTLRWHDLIGGVIWLVGFLFEAVGDRQLRLFVSKSENKGKLMTEGLWKYTRHPNYFGEVTMWWGIWIIVRAVTGAYWTILSPLLITYLILKVSGIPLLEKRYAGNQEWEAYKAKTSVFFPWFPKE